MTKEQTLFAFYGTLRHGEGNWKWALKDKAKYIKTVVVYGYEMFSLGGYPIVIPSEDKTAPITIELFENTDQQSVNSIDRMERGAGYDHVMLDIDGEEYLMYVGNPRYYTKDKMVNYFQIHGGDWIKYINSPQKVNDPIC